MGNGGARDAPAGDLSLGGRRRRRRHSTGEATVPDLRGRRHPRFGLRGRPDEALGPDARRRQPPDRKSTRLNSSHITISYAVFCLKKKKKNKKKHQHKKKKKQKNKTKKET